MARQPQYLQGFREASKLAIKLTHEVAAEMNDPPAKRAMDSFAHLLGVTMKNHYRDRQEDSATPLDEL